MNERNGGAVEILRPGVGLVNFITANVVGDNLDANKFGAAAHGSPGQARRERL